MRNIYLFLTFLLFVGCNNSWAPCGQEHFLDADQKINVELNDTLEYSSVLDTIRYVVTLLESGVVPCSQTGQSESECVAYYEFEMIGICPLGENSCRDTVEKTVYYEGKACPDCQNCMTICKKMSAEPIHRFYKYMEDPYLSYFDQWSDRFSTYSRYQPRFWINDQMYPKCFVFSISNGDLSELYYNHKQGFIGFKTVDGLLYNLKI
ncbi:MAG: hypothetical protein R2751_06960 [Bacteroidales bacterium]